MDREDCCFIIEEAPDGIFKTDKTGKYTYVNPAGCKMLGYTLEEMVEMKITDVVLLKDVERVSDEFKILVEKGRLRAEYDLVKKDKSILPVALNAIQIKEEYLGFCKDISERKKTEEALKENLQHFRSLVDSCL